MLNMPKNISGVKVETTLQKYWNISCEERKRISDVEWKKWNDKILGKGPGGAVATHHVMKPGKTIHVLQGVSASGKSRFASKFPNIKQISSDKLRLELFGTLDHDPKQHYIVFESLHYILGFMSEIFETFYDATNINRRKRRYFYHDIVKQMDRYGQQLPPVVTIDVFIEPLEVLKKNNRKKPRKEKVPSKAIEKMYMNFQIPRAGLDCESYTVHGETAFFKEKMTYEKLVSLNSLEELYATISKPYAQEMEKIFGPHDTPYHLEDIDKHINMCIDAAGDDEVMKITAMFHDLGKGIAKDGGTYQNHEFVSSMYAMKAFSEIDDMKNTELILENIYYHLAAHKGISKKRLKREFISQRQLDSVMAFSKIDNESRVIDETYRK